MCYLSVRYHRVPPEQADLEIGNETPSDATLTFQICQPSPSDLLEIPCSLCLAEHTRPIQSKIDKSEQGIAEMRLLSIPPPHSTSTDDSTNLERPRPCGLGVYNKDPIFAPITPVVKERVGDVATRLSEV
jgi:hypothetical protein